MSALTTALAVMVSPAAAAASAKTPDRVGLQSRLDDIVAAGAVGGLAEVRDEHGVWRGSSGVAELDTTRAVPVDGRFRVGSITKTVAEPPTFEPPGSAFAYSNTNYILLGQIIEKVTGRSYGKEIKRRIIRPLRLTGTVMPRTTPRIVGPHPYGYVPKDADSNLVDYTKMNPSVLGPGGEMISTTSDLNQFFAALLGGRLLPGRLLAEMRTEGVVGARYGLGLAWWRDTSCGVRVYGNDGDALAYQSWSYSTEDRRRQVTVALTPNFRGDPDDAIDAFLDKAICG
ncbi:beta-lactamase family protein [Micromonospora sp. LAH09]|uniref:serine hydrolase domain-containing protein n=1 Tax=Micromonospora cabrerizensis TaxID=2911213 RepID=UPI001EE8240C|nr:serine hydrolase domain-containing protein [Micromonospora cabrerizensis]MCG5468906.1 beta-lactamase family protein [Micromonospora cabrerizensis]